MKCAYASLQVPWPFERKMSLLSSALITPIFPRDSIFREIAVSLLRRVQKSSSWSPKRQKIIMDREIKLAFSLFFRSEIGMFVRDFCRVRGFPHYRHHHHTESRELFFGSTMPRQLPWINNARSSEINSLLLWENVPSLVGRLWGNVLFFARLCQHFCLRRAMTKVLRFAVSSFPKSSHHIWWTATSCPYVMLYVKSK